jgi:hypothetical protein
MDHIEKWVAAVELCGHHESQSAAFVHLLDALAMVRYLESEIKAYENGERVPNNADSNGV